MAFVLASPLVAQQQDDRKPAANSLVRLLQSKGILTDEEAAMVTQAASTSESNQRLAKLLLSKGVISQEDYEQTVGAAVVPAATQGSTGARLVPAVLRTRVAGSGGSTALASPAPAAPKVIPALTPVRVFPVDPPKREGLIPAFKLGPVKLAPYGFFKASFVRDSSSQGGNDFPLPQFLGDTGPDASPEARLKARFFRIGSNFEWPDASPKLTVTGRFELDFEGDFTRVNNTNLSTIRSSQPRIRLAYGRLDYAATDTTTIHALFGQDWTPFVSSTLSSIFDTTGPALGYGEAWERLPQFRFGFMHNFGGSRTFKIQPEVAIVYPAFGNTPGSLLAGSTTFTVPATLPATITAPVTITGVPGVDNQLAFGERQGADSGRPEVEGRIAFQFQLDKAPGVAPAQIIVSGMQGERQANVLASAIPTAFKAAFTRGAQVSSSRYGFTGEIQLPTRFATLAAKYYNGEDLRFFFAGQFFSTFNDTAGLFIKDSTGACVTPSTANPLPTAASIDASSTVVFGFSDAACTTATIAPQRPVRAQGGFVSLGFPLSRIFGANPEGRNNGWSLYLYYGIDYAKARDVRRFVTAAGSRLKSDLANATLYYKLNNWVTFAFEQSLYRTRALTGPGIALPLFRGSPSREAHDVRTEVGTIFSF
jgi:hypothetical protein